MYLNKHQEFVLYQLKVRLLFYKVMETSYIDRVRFSDIKRTFLNEYINLLVYFTKKHVKVWSNTYIR